MKLNYKLLIILLILINVISCFSGVEAVGRTTQAWKIVREGASEPDLLFRTYTTPHWSLLEEYTNTQSEELLDEKKQDGSKWTYITNKGNEAFAKWIYNEAVDVPGPVTFGTVRMVFHTDPLCNYTNTGTSWGYNQVTEEIGMDISTIQNVVDSSNGIYIKSPGKNSVSKDNEIYAVEKIKGTYYNVSNTGTGLFLKNIQRGKLTEYRYALIKVDGAESDRNIYLEDSIVYSEDLKNLVEKLGEIQECYVTDELITETYKNSGKYEVAKTAEDFTKLRKTWSYEARGTKGYGYKALGSALNMYDNILVFPQSSQRKVYVRHIDIGTNSTIDETIVSKGNTITDLGDQKYILVSGKKVELKSISPSSTYPEIYDNISVTDSITKYALKKQDLNCLGYNVAISSNWLDATNVISNQVSQGEYIASDTVYVPGNSIDSNDDVIVINFYYNKEKTEEVVEPTENLQGNVFVIPTPNQADEKIYNVVCNDTDSNPTTSFPSGHNATVGIENIPKSMAGAISLKRNDEQKEFKLTFKIKRGTNDDSITYSFKYKVPYYSVTNMLVYKFREGIIYDAGAGYEGTQGSNMFNWNTLTTNHEKDELLIKDTSESLNVILKGLNGKTIDNTNKAISDINNYVSAHLNISDKNTGLKVDDYNGLDIINYNEPNNELALTIVDISNDDWNAVDINNDGELDENDLRKAASGSSSLKKELDAAETAMKNAKTAMKNAETAMKNAETSKNNAEKNQGVKDIKTHLALFEKKLTQDVLKESTQDDNIILGKIDSLMKRFPEEISDFVTDYRNYKENNWPWQSFQSKWGISPINWSDETKNRLTDCENKYIEKENQWAGYMDSVAWYEEANKNYNTLAEDYTTKQNTYDALKKQYDDIIANYEKWEQKYDITKEKLALYEKIKKQIADPDITPQNLADLYNINVNIEAKNMDITINNKSLYPVQEQKNALINFNTFNTLVAERTYSMGKTYTLDMGEVPSISKQLYSNLTGSLIQRTNYKNSSLVNKNIINGVRWLKGEAKYDTAIIIGEDTNAVKDTAYEIGETFEIPKNKVLKKTYTVNSNAEKLEDKYKEVTPINVYTPITVESTIESEQNQIVNQTTGKFEIPVIQINTPFTVKITNNNSEAVYSYASTPKYNKGYYIKFDFDVHNVKIDGKLYKNGEKINAGTWIGFLSVEEKTKGKEPESIDIDTTTINVAAQAYGSTKENTLNPVSDERNSYTVRSVAYNATDLMRNISKLYPTLDDFVVSEHGPMISNICSNPSYFAEATNEIIMINRLYDFRVTDVKDIEWKESFRTNSVSDVNKHTGNVYYTGITKWDTSSTSLVNKISNRTVAEIGRNPLRILPIGPYKNTDITKIKAPKLGYRFSFDFKITGSYYKADGEIRKDKTANIKTKFYYISKDGKNFIEEPSGGKGIYLFYKNSAGKYVRIDDNGGNYNLTYTPYDGYRYISDSTTDTLSKTSVSLGNLRIMTLKYNMATPTNNRGAITYYGEYKLPNSTIAVEVDSNGKYDINKPLTDGYIGVIFDIYSNAGTITQDNQTIPIILSYSQNTEDKPNTSQWDYEGFLGYKNYGNDVKSGELSMKLEKGTWKITDEIYNKIKGTVVLYDIDQRAATDYE